MAVRYSERFGQVISDLIYRHRITLQQASVKTHGAISPAWWGEMRRGRIPSREIIEAVVTTFPDDDLTELWVLAGYTFPDAPKSMEEEVRRMERIRVALGIQPSATLGAIISLAEDALGLREPSDSIKDSISSIGASTY